jgi:hypothetical protein
LGAVFLRSGVKPEAWNNTITRFGEKFHIASGAHSSLKKFVNKIGVRWLWSASYIHSIPLSRKADDRKLRLSVNGRQKLLYADEHWILYFIRRAVFALNNGQLFYDYNRPITYLEWKVRSGRLQV